LSKEKRLIPKYRKLLSQIIIEHLVASNIQPKQNLLKEISEKIVLLFECDIKVIFVTMNIHKFTFFILNAFRILFIYK